MGVLLEINQLNVTFHRKDGNVEAVKNVSLNIEDSQVLALVGESGSGKTVLCKSILRLDNKAEVENGSILLQQNDLLKCSEKEMERVRGKEISMVFQDPMTSLNPTFSIGSQITEAILLHERISKKEARKRAIELLELVGIDYPDKRYSQYPHHFSGGMRQRVAIAIALACQPKLLLADEPTTALDRNTQEQILILLKNIQVKTGIAVLFITHDLSLVESIADRIAVMYQGEIVEENTVARVFSLPQHAYTKRLLGYMDYGKRTGHTHGKIHFHGGVAHTHDDIKKSHTVTVEDFGGIVGSNEEKKRTVLLEVNKLSKEFQLDKYMKTTVFHDFSMKLYQGEIVGLVGNSGCGKSTLARCIMGLYPPTRGEIIYHGDKLRRYKKQMIFQDSASALNPRMTIEEIIAEPLKIKKLYTGKKDLWEKVYFYMEQAELDSSLGKRHPYDVSGGQRQRAAIARAISVEPELIVADEPISSLDISIQAQIIHLFKRLQEQYHLTILLIAHDIPMVEHISDRIIYCESPSKRSGNGQACLSR